MFSRLYDRYFIKKPAVRLFVTKLLEKDEDIDIDLLCSRLKVNSIKEHGYLRASRMAKFSSLFRDEIPVLMHLAALLPGSDTFIDVGANVGVFSASLSKLKSVFQDIEFLAFEANPDTFSRLSRTVENLQVKTHCIALSNKTGELEFVSGTASGVFTAIDYASSYNNKEKTIVPCRRLDSFDISGVSMVIKIDVEGQEMDVLEGSSKFFEKRFVKAVYLDGYSSKNRVENFLRGYGFSFFDGRSLQPVEGDVFSLLAIHGAYL
ncbi:FkbM family methyltransferase [Nodosilinea sp. LEGE 07088]|uniref:FkbM family methyltransferase n=1 Tax=Nodosilinea sp. LEGE 07088 TaxID=2777968 RepID=UPI0018826805|nr:FkbM family methyltransferase [Nodosilinea sp. LEGE 07088]MBE9135940.1 FkbM family methyltransferase [Nodosilinea sp. LEGE 07088]